MYVWWNKRFLPSALRRPVRWVWQSHDSPRTHALTACNPGTATESTIYNNDSPLDPAQYQAETGKCLPSWNTSYIVFKPCFLHKCTQYLLILLTNQSIVKFQGPHHLGWIIKKIIICQPKQLVCQIAYNIYAKQMENKFLEISAICKWCTQLQPN